jgi:hypothetical protein
MFNLIFNQLINDYTAPEDRKPQRLAFLRVFLAGVRLIWLDFLSFRTDANRRASATAQTMSLERMLNLKYYAVSAWSSIAAPTAGGRIWIENVATLLPSNFIYNDNENQAPIYIYNDSEGETPPYIYNESEYISQYDFIVKVPVALTYDADEMKAIIDNLKFAGTRYTIETY